MKKILSLLAVALLLPLSLKANDKLQFDSKGEFKIMQLTDIHTTPDDLAYGNEIKELLDIEKPNFIVITGDFIEADGTTQSVDNAIVKAVAPINDYCMKHPGVQWDYVMGNHDYEHINKFDMNQIGKPVAYDVDSFIKNHKEYNGYFARPTVQNGVVPDYKEYKEPNIYIPVPRKSDIKEDRAEIDKKLSDLTINGKGYNNGINWALPIYSSTTQSNIPAGVIYGLDTHGVGTGIDTAGDRLWLQQEAVNKYNEWSSEYNRVPALMFMHVPVYNMHYADHHDYEGTKGEDICSYNPKFEYASGVESSLLKNIVLNNSDVMGMFFGHDHINDFIVKRSQYLWLAYGRTTKYNGRDISFGSRVFVMHEGKYFFNTWIRDLKKKSTTIDTFQDIPKGVALTRNNEKGFVVTDGNNLNRYKNSNFIAEKRWNFKDTPNSVGTTRDGSSVWVVTSGKELKLSTDSGLSFNTRDKFGDEPIGIAVSDYADYVYVVTNENKLDCYYRGGYQKDRDYHFNDQPKAVATNGNGSIVWVVTSGNELKVSNDYGRNFYTADTFANKPIGVALSSDGKKGYVITSANKLDCYIDAIYSQGYDDYFSDNVKSVSTNSDGSVVWVATDRELKKLEIDVAKGQTL